MKKKEETLLTLTSLPLEAKKKETRMRKVNPKASSMKREREKGKTPIFPLEDRLPSKPRKTHKPSATEENVAKNPVPDTYTRFLLNTFFERKKRRILRLL